MCVCSVGQPRVATWLFTLFCAPEFMTDSEAYAEPDKSRKVDPPPGVEGGVIVAPATEGVEAIAPSSCR